MKQQQPDFAISVAAVDWGRSLVLIAATEADARPWLRLLALAGAL